jgi:hypothetical protein
MKNPLTASGILWGLNANHAGGVARLTSCCINTRLKPGTRGSGNAAQPLKQQDLPVVNTLALAGTVLDLI